MITFEDALKIARELKQDVDRCYEYEDAYVFSSKEDDNYEGTHEPCVVMKEDGKAKTMLWYVEHGKGIDIIKEISL